MKSKLIAVALFVATAFNAQAQETTTTVTASNVKPTAGNVTTEVLFNDLGNISLNNGLLRARYFTSDQFAYRLSLGVNYNYDKIADDAHSRVFGISLAPGIEKHFAGTNRLSPYIGAELPIRMQSAKTETENSTITGATSTNGANRGYFSVGLNAVAGVDFYFAKNFYAGVELGTGLAYFKNADIEVESPGFDNKTEGFHSIRFGQFVNGGIRVGYVF
ncbi:hypothetical protein [Pontibacter burrus]|uniref:Outer membrane protein beta-barrel domain-containing protein n=1 Tax=Pontibacter burrus TaxID=2704466 RepID=A0A6B3M0W7_9BACT|nr:hypothetical protein [Pontibacter burrus]NEM99231.1 hypothetical protein [Pontibacter burrus]